MAMAMAVAVAAGALFMRHEMVDMDGTHRNDDDSMNFDRVREWRTINAETRNRDAMMEAAP